MTSHRSGFYIGLVKWRNQLLALFCLFLFAAFGVFYFRNWVVQKPFAIILFIGGGLNPSTVAATRVYGGGVDTPLAIDSLNYTALLKNYSNDFATPDNAAAATAIATGVKVNNGSLGIGPHGEMLQNLLDLAQTRGRATGLITNANLTDPTPAAFYGHTTEAQAGEELARDLVENAKIDVVLGGGSADFLPTAKGGRRTDDRDLLLEVRRGGYDLVRTRGDLEAIPRWRRPRLFGVFNTAELAFAGEAESRGEHPSLADMVRRGIELLQFNRGGYLLVVDAGLMRKAAQENRGEQTLLETGELDRAVSIALRYAGKSSTVIVCGDVSVGGLSLNGSPYREDSGIAVLGLNSAGDPWITWATGPNGPPRSTPAEPGDRGADSPTSPAPDNDAHEPAALRADTALNVASDSIAFGNGHGAEALHGTLESTAVFEIIRDSL